MFKEDLIPNDLKMVDDTIRKYYKPAPVAKPVAKKASK
jgi:hypothetical protein